MKLSVIIPHCYGLKNVDHALKVCVDSLVGYDEIIVLANDQMGYGAAVNEGLRLAHGDHFVVCNNDMKLLSGTLRDLAVNNAVTVPEISPEPRDDMPRGFYCLPRNIYNDVIEQWGYFYDERFEKGYWEDDDLIYRLKYMQIEIRKIQTVHIHHFNGGGMTMKQIGEQEYYDRNKEQFLQKWEG